MTVGELMELLKHFDQDRQVIMQRDSEGNGYSPLYGTRVGAYKADSTYSGECGLEELTEEDIQAGYTGEDLIVGGVPACILCPIN